jgi:adenine phosphoribosyltransferase
MDVAKLSRPSELEKLRRLIRDVPDFPKQGIIFRDITPLLKNPFGLKKTVDIIEKFGRRLHADSVAAIEARGFILGSAVSVRLGCGFVPIRKKKKLPWKTISQEYQLEYGTDAVEVHEDAFKKGERVLLVDDVLATGGTLQASAKLIEKLGAKVSGIAILVELVELGGIEKLKDYNTLVILRL